MSSVSCSAPSCDASIYIKKRQLCRSHYNRFMLYGDLATEHATAECLRCSGIIARDRKQTGPPPKYCTEICRRLAAYERRIASGAQAISDAKVRAAFQPKPITERSCDDCGGSFLAKRSDAEFCSRKCTQRFRRLNPDRPCSIQGCGRAHEARGLCSMHWKREAYADGRIVSEPWTERRKANWHKRRAQKLNLPADNIRPADIYERDEWVCGICSMPVDRALTHPDPMSPSLDHILPLSLGGHHTMENVTLSHLSCNVRKGNRVEVDAMSV